MRRLMLLAAMLALSLMRPAVAQVGDPGAFSFASATYSVDLGWAGTAADGVVLSGEIEANGMTGSVSQELTTGDVFLNERVPMPVLVRDARTTANTLTLDLWLPVPEISGVVTLAFSESHIVHRSEFHIPSAAFVPTIESVVRVQWNHAFDMHGSVDPNDVITFDGGQALDQYGVWEDAHRYGVFLSDAGGAFVGHARLIQGSMANYLNDGTFRAGSAHTEVRSFFNGFLDAGTAGIPEALWTIDALAFMAPGSTPGAFAGLLDNFPGFGAFSPPAPGNLAGDGQVVIAVADTGINPYHEDFHNPGFAAHPSTYLSGYPASAPALNLTFGSDYAASRTADAAVWSSVQQNKLYWIPGTKIVGAFSIGNPPVNPVPGTEPPAFPERFVIDDLGHGTGTASVAAGYRHGTCEQCLLVIIEGTNLGVEWAAAQPWIDMISNSYGPTASLPIGESDFASREAYNAGKSVLYSSGNGFTGTGLVPDRNPTYTRPTSGPSWVVSVGAASPRNDQEHSWYGVPADVISYGSAYPAAAFDSVTGEQVFTGTSCATPITAGVEGSLLLYARRTLGDATEGTAGGILAALDTGTAPASGPLADGVLTRNELEAVLLKTAIPTAFNPAAPIDLTTVPGHPASFLTEGYGLVNRTSLARGLDVLDGTAALPSRPNEDAWVALNDGVRDLIWGTP